MAGVGDDVDERRLVILFGNGGVVHALGQKCARLHGLQGQAHRQPHALARDGALEKDRFPVQRARAGDDPVWDILHLAAVAGIGHPGNLGEDLFADIGDERGNAAHIENLRGRIDTGVPDAR